MKDRAQWVLDCLASEGIGIEDLDMDGVEFIFDDEAHGFIAMRMVHGLPELCHFYVCLEHRTPENARRLVKRYRVWARTQGHKWGFIQTRDDCKLKRLIEYYFRTARQRGTRDGHAFYLVEV